MHWSLYLLYAVLAFTSNAIMQRTIAVKSDHPRLAGLTFNLYGALLAIILYFLTSNGQALVWPTDPKVWFIFILAATGYGFFERFRFLAAKLVEASVLTTVFNISVLVAFIGALLLYGETASPHNFIGSLLILISLILVSYHRAQPQKDKITQRGLVIAVAISASLGLGFMLDKMGVLHFGTALYTPLIWIGSLIFLIFPLPKLSQLIAEFKLGGWPTAFMALFNVTGYVAQLKALEQLEAIKVIPIVQTSIILTVLAGVIMLKERDHLWKKIAAAILAVAGVALLV